MSEEIRRLAERIRATEKQVSALSRPQLSWSTVEGGAIVVKDDQGTPRMTMGVQADGTHTIKHVQGPPPPAPSAPVVTPDLSTLLVAWDGTFAGPRPEDWDRVDVHVSQDQHFTPSTGTLRGSIVSQDGGDLTLRVTGGTWHVRLVAVSRAEVHSAPSNPVTVLVEGITDRVKDDIEASEGRLSEAQQKALEELAELDRKLAGVGAKAEEATLSARNAHNVAVEAQSVADDALAKYGPLDKRTIDAQKAARDAQAKAEEAYSTAEGVSGDVAQAKADADTARREATAAQSSASQAQAKADEAQAEAKQAQSVADDALAKYGPLDKRTIDAQARADQAKQEANQAHLEALASKSLADAAKKRADEAYALAQSKLSGAEVDKRILQSANGKNTITVSTSPPGSSKGIAGDLWRRVDSNGHVFAEWTHDGSAWKTALIRSDMITNLDVHKLTVSGSASVAEAVIEKLWVDGIVGKSATFQQMTVASGNLVPNGDFSQGLEHWRESPNWELVPVADLPGITTAVKATGNVSNAYTGPVFPLDSSRRYRFEVWMRASKPGSRFYLEIRNQDGTLVVRNSKVVEGPFTTLGTYPIANSLVPTSWAKAVIEFDVTDGSTSGRIATLYFNHSNGATRDADVYMTGIKLYPVDGVVQLVDGQVTAPKITASKELTAKIAQFLTVRAGQIEADAIDGMTITGATVQTSRDHPKSLMDTAGFHVTDTDGMDQITLGQAGGDLLSIRDAEGTPMATVSNLGEISGAGLNIDSDPVFNGLPLVGQSQEVLAPTSAVELSSWFDALPRGLIAHGRENNQAGWEIKSGGGEMALMEVQADLKANRMYKITLSPIMVQNVGGSWVDVFVKYDWKGNRPTFDSTTMRKFSATSWKEGEILQFGGSWLYSPGADEDTRFLLSIRAGKRAQIHTAGQGISEMIIEDVGPFVDNVSVRRGDNDSVPAETPSAPKPKPPPPPPQPKNYTKKYWANGGRTFYTRGGWRNQNRDKCYQGTMPGMGGVQSIATFPSMTGDLSGATITAMTAYVYMEHFYYGSGGVVKLIGHNRLSSDITKMPDGWKLLKTSNRIGRTSGVQIPIPREYWNDFKTGNLKGIGLGDNSPSTSEYGYGPWKRMWIEVKYRK